MATVIFSGQVAGNTMRVVDAGSGLTPRITVEIRSPSDAMGTFGWQRFDPIPTPVLEALLVAAHVIGP
jgi:hypothetical protein